MSPKKFLFITHLTPKAKRSALREGLLEVMDESLKAQTYTEWKALRIGEEERTEGPIQTIDTASADSLRSVYLRPDEKALIDWADYVVKLNDDDIILPHTLEIASKLEFDLYGDRFHTFHDITTDRTTQQQRPWIAATCMHKKEHAITLNRGEGVADNFINSLFYGEHGRDWIAYYAKRNVIFAQPTTPDFVPSSDYYKTNQDKRNLNTPQSFFEQSLSTSYSPSQEYITDDMIFSMTEDHKGNIWFATRDHGICRYDGMTFTTVGRNEGLDIRGATAILQDDTSSFWITTFDSGVWYYDGSTFTQFTESNGLVNNAVMSILKDKDGHIWFGTKWFGLSRYDGKTFTTFSQHKQ
jgi:hypothetical protein